MDCNQITQDLDDICLVPNFQLETPTQCLRSPSYGNVSVFLDSLERTMAACHGDCCITGDINIDIKTDSIHPRADDYLNLLAHYGFAPGFTCPTRGPNCLDHFFLKSRLVSTAIVCRAGITDHDTVLFSVDKVLTPIPSDKNLKKVDYDGLLTDLQEADWAELYKHTDINTATDEFTKIVNLLISKHSKASKQRKRFDCITPWMSPGLLKCVERRDILHLDARKNPNDTDLVIKYKSYRNTCNNIIQNRKNDYERNEIINSRGDSKKTWQTLKRICGISTKQSLNTDLTKIESSPLKSLNSVNHYFCTVGENLANEILKTVEKTEIQLANNIKKVPLLHASCESFFLLPTDETEIIQIISSLKKKSSSGHDNINNIILIKAKYMNLLTLNAAKTNLIPFSISKRTKPSHPLHLVVHKCPRINLENCGCPSLKQINISEPPFHEANCLIIDIENSFTIIALYRSPSYGNVSVFLDSLERTMAACHGDCCITGDINIDIKTDSIHPRADDYLNLLAHYGFAPGFTCPTRGPNCLDHFFLKSRLVSTAIVCRAGITDHDTVLFSVDKVLTPIPSDKNLKKVDYDGLLTDLQEADWAELYKHTDINTATDEFT
ncbi:Uncharacterized protein OBRU01_09475 [Operophtera brumata]|uniref:Tick transposon n=1 Tax=Operophtera brumata TaxID=104452 RepID=A0A0L7LFH9_OPEBR|nr:Uncharacterized protein OBRU01_09475 [Operophtera brumata]